MNMKYCINPGWSTLYTDFIYEISTCIIDSELLYPVMLHDLRYMNSILLLISRFVRFLFCDFKRGYLQSYIMITK